MNMLRAAMNASLSALEGTMFPPIAFVLICGIVGLVGTGRKQQRLGEHVAMPWYALTHLLFFPAVVAVGAVFHAGSFSGDFGVSVVPNRIGDRLVDVLSYASLASCVFWIWRMKGFRWFALSLMTVLEMPILGALFVAGMSVTGDWL